ncbi:gamma-glutamyltransferase family protein [Rosenbergiella australiborealis]|uniref:gamma-glutamyltransferase family protein n=1 Tax=Rosenbergiella australiborealis TaxID=1544696 RepID=UPI001F4EC601|nr:gamma-glutamyltransferase family protein [Rosenbergiella australiborealis]
MRHSNVAPNGMVVTPHHLASHSALAILRQGGNAIEAMVAAAATIAVVYPHMNGLGGDGFWLIVPPEGEPIAIDASGAAGSLATLERYQAMATIPFRGPQAALTVAGTVSGWQRALEYANEHFSHSLPLSTLLADAIQYAESGIPVTASQAAATKNKASELVDLPGFSDIYLPDHQVPSAGDCLRQPDLARSLRALVKDGLESFYRGPLGEKITAGMETLGMPITGSDLAEHHAQFKTPLSIKHSCGSIYNLAPPTQGVVSLAMLGILDRLDISACDEIQTIHRIVEATKLAFSLRDQYVTDPRDVSIDLQQLLSAPYLDQLSQQLNTEQAAPWGEPLLPGDTVWMGVTDKAGYSVSFIQSIYHEFGSGVVIPETGIIWQNRGAAFSLQPGHPRCLAPKKYPFHTLNPAAAKLHDGRTLVYGSMGGDGQPQTQATLFTRYVQQHFSLQEAISAPRWLLGRTWGNASDSLKLEARFSEETYQGLRALGHLTERLDAWSEATGHAGAIVRHPNGFVEGASDPRSNGSAAGY